MIGFLAGEVKDRNSHTLTLFTGAPQGAGVGYQVTIPDRPDYLDFQTGSFAQLYIHSHVREDAFDLFGFKSSEERRLFLTLTSVSGIGPKLGIALLTGMPPNDLIQNILQKNIDALVAIPGVGKKTAERMIVEIKDKLEKWGLETRSFKAPSHGIEVKSPSSTVISARMALQSLGFKEQEAEKLLQLALDQWTSKDPMPVEALIKLSLQLSQKKALHERI
jgi:Holliday junction DNA helicase RuvA